MIRRVRLDDREVHIIGAETLVGFNMKRENVKVIGDNGKAIGEGTLTVPDYSKPYIFFGDIRETGSGEYFLEDECGLQGGLSADEAREISSDLFRAARYVEEKGWEQEDTGAYENG